MKVQLVAGLFCAILFFGMVFAAPVEDEEDKDQKEVGDKIPTKDVEDSVSGAFDRFHEFLKEHTNKPVFVGVDIPSIFNFKFLKAPGKDGQTGVNVDIPIVKSIQEAFSSMTGNKEKTKGDLDY